MEGIRTMRDAWEEAETCAGHWKEEPPATRYGIVFVHKKAFCYSWAVSTEHPVNVVILMGVSQFHQGGGAWRVAVAPLGLASSIA